MDDTTENFDIETQQKVKKTVFLEKKSKITR